MIDIDKKILRAINEYIASTCMRVTEPFKHNNKNHDSIGTIKKYSSFVKTHRSKNIRMLKKSIKDNLIRAVEGDVVDPLLLGYTFISFSDYDFSETRWTQWLCNCLKDKYVGEIFWKALCSAVAQNYGLNKIKSDENANHQYIRNWIEIATKHNHKTNEYIPEYPIKCKNCRDRRMDIYINNEQNKYKICIENKVGAERSEDQLEDYKAALVKRCKKSAECGLVYLTEAMRGDGSLPPGYVNIDYETLAIMLRKELRARLARATSKTKAGRLIKLSPVLQTIISIEKDILGFDVNLKNSHDPEDVSILEKISAYLKKGK